MCRPMVDLDATTSVKQLKFFSHASANPKLGMGAVFNNQWLYAKWELGYITENGPRIEYLELLVLTAALLTWGQQLCNQHIVIFCDNQAVVSMINNASSSCKRCMKLLRFISLNNLICNRRVFACYIKSADNVLSDALSHLQFKCFWDAAPITMNKNPTAISPIVWPASKIWEE